MAAGTYLRQASGVGAFTFLLLCFAGVCAEASGKLEPVNVQEHAAHDSRHVALQKLPARSSPKDIVTKEVSSAGVAAKGGHLPEGLPVKHAVKKSVNLMMRKEKKGREAVATSDYRTVLHTQCELWASTLHQAGAKSGLLSNIRASSA